MFVLTANKLLAATSIVIALCSATGCGDDDGADEARDGGPPTPRAGRGGSGGRAGAGGASSLVPLPDKTAGKSCDADKDCGSGMCLQTFQGAFGGSAMQAPGGYCSATCMTNVDCGAGGTCSGAFAGIGGIGATAGRCLKSCSTDTECREGYRCVNALGMSVTDAGVQDPTGGLFGSSGCEPLPAVDKLGDGVVGSPCEEAKDCGAGRCQKTTGGMTYPGGYCTGACLKDSDCGAKGSCTPALSGAGTCYLGCGSDSDCREGYRCRGNGAVMQCVPGAPPLADGIAGSACTADADCGGAAMSCAARVGNSSAPGGYCSLACVDDSDCGSSGACVGGLGATLAGILGPTGACYAACSEAADCREGYSCAQAGGFGNMSMQKVCSVTPPSAAEDAGVE
ncbi:MAG TPA: hypothetical protein VJV78_17585 [Polyangiales bacterium]|nr:hypothetical protein [Polyangiales bacterium]